MMELDVKSQRDLWLLAQSGVVGRTYFNKLLFEVMLHHAAGPDCTDLSNLVSHRVSPKKFLLHVCI